MNALQPQQQIACVLQISIGSSTHRTHPLDLCSNDQHTKNPASTMILLLPTSTSKPHPDTISRPSPLNAPKYSWSDGHGDWNSRGRFSGEIVAMVHQLWRNRPGRPRFVLYWWISLWLLWRFIGFTDLRLARRGLVAPDTLLPSEPRLPGSLPDHEWR